MKFRVSCFAFLVACAAFGQSITATKAYVDRRYADAMNAVPSIVTNEVAEFTPWRFSCDVPEIQAALDAAELHPVFIPFDNGGYINGNGYWKVQDIPQVDGYEIGTPMSDPTWESATTVEYLCAYRLREFEYVSIFATRSRIVRNALGLAKQEDVEKLPDHETVTNIARAVSNSFWDERDEKLPDHETVTNVARDVSNTFWDEKNSVLWKIAFKDGEPMFLPLTNENVSVTGGAQ